jgi:predicted acylesterase/phospholipase RssA
MTYSKSITFMIIALVSFVLSGCASITRQNFTPDIIAKANTDTLNGIRFSADAPPKLAIPDSQKDYNVLALSGGGPDGAFGVGLLAGWTKSGARPEFDVVTGVSTGALMAPFAFLGSAEDETLHNLYTGDHISVLLAEGSPAKLLLGPNLYRNRKLKAMIEANITIPILAAIAAEHNKGRRLFVATANLDAQRMTIWDMGAIAKRATPQSRKLFQTLLLAATSVPLAFDPIAIPVPGSPKGFTETHVDASVFTHLYAAEELFPINACRARARKCTLHVIVHNKAVAEPQTVRWSAIGIGKRAFETAIKANLNTRLQATWQIAKANTINFRMAYLDVPFASVSPIDFNIEYMQNLYEIGLRKGQIANTWLDTPATIR